VNFSNDHPQATRNPTYPTWLRLIPNTAAVDIVGLLLQFAAPTRHISGLAIGPTRLLPAASFLAPVANDRGGFFAAWRYRISVCAGAAWLSMM
jgi:hypothetical protein